MLQAIKQKLKHLPARPGVYQMKDKRGKIIYIGKAKILRNRVRAYFQARGPLDPKTAALVRKIADFEVVVTDSEVEALILEANLVKEHKPRYNVNLKDDKHYPYLKVTVNEPFPRLLVARRVQKDGARYFGPYTSAQSMRRTMKFLMRMFNLRSCNLEIPSPTGRKYKVCLDYHIGRCGGPCENLESAEQYKQHVDAVLMFLSGRRTDLIKVLTERMQEHSARMEFEQAARVRDTIDALESVRQKQKVDAAAEVDRDIVAFARGAGREVVAVVMQIREGILIGKQDFQMQANPDMGSDDVLTGFLQQYYNSSENFPAEILLPFEIADVALLERWLTREKGSRVRIVATRKGDRRSLVDMAQKNARLLLDELLLQKQKHKEKVPALIASLQKDLALAKPPRTIGCFDISNLGESDKVASMVYFLDGKPRKSEYRRFKIKSVQGQDDFASMREVIDRYFTRAMKEKRTLPDLIVVDGGKGQLSAAKEIIDSLGLASHPIIGLAKRLEEVFLPGYAEPVSIPKDSASLNMLKRIRDEAHRFAITYHRQMRGKRLVSSELDNITGVGKSRRQLLMDHFGSLRRIRQAPLEELSAIDGIPDRVARSVFDYFQSSQKESAQSDQ